MTALRSVAVVAVALVGAGPACADPAPSQLFVDLKTDLVAPQEFARIGVRVTGPAGVLVETGCAPRGPRRQQHAGHGRSLVRGG